MCSGLKLESAGQCADCLGGACIQRSAQPFGYVSARTHNRYQMLPQMNAVPVTGGQGGKASAAVVSYLAVRVDHVCFSCCGVCSYFSSMLCPAEPTTVLSCIYAAYVSVSVESSSSSAVCVFTMVVLTASCCAPGMLCFRSLDFEHTASWYRLGTSGVPLMCVLHMLSAESHCGCRKLLPAW
jgi:hypothetical protein